MARIIVNLERTGICVGMGTILLNRTTKESPFPRLQRITSGVRVDTIS